MNCAFIMAIPKKSVELFIFFYVRIEHVRIRQVSHMFLILVFVFIRKTCPRDPLKENKTYKSGFSINI